MCGLAVFFAIGFFGEAVAVFAMSRMLRRSHARTFKAISQTEDMLATNASLTETNRKLETMLRGFIDNAKTAAPVIRGSGPV